MLEYLDFLATLPVERILLPDTLGILTPTRTALYLNKVLTRFPNLRFDFHGHNDYDLSVDVQLYGDSVDLTTLGDYSVIYTATDNAGNQVQKQRVVRVQDTTPPVITLVPDTETVYLNVGDTYSLPNAILTDNHDGSPQFLQTPTLDDALASLFAPSIICSTYICQKLAHARFCTI